MRAREGTHGNGEDWHPLHDEEDFDNDDWGPLGTRVRITSEHLAGELNDRRPPTLVERVARLEERLDAVESHLGITPVEGANSSLRWLLSQPDSRERYHGKFVAISMLAPEHGVVAMADDLATLLEQIDDISTVYIHQMI